ncbi:ran-binding protein 3-like isoform X2 [Ruditapes philippinarum]|uniref:ran-binding protein 3-like isoform X2 n=1 Tax=Ruditapes philippinarum TaxID=129788 RepID=UPI00295A8D29|nr:ran-binding protein 3-like isoform X2 [Ruditapes philippinarum]
MADSETQSARQCPDTGQTVPESSDETEVSSASGGATNGSSNDPPAYDSYQAIKPAKFVPTINAPSMNPFAARPTLKSDVVSTSGTYTGAPNPPKFVLRPSALSAHPLNNKNDVCGAETGSAPPLLKPAKLPDPTKGLTKESEVTEKENKDSGTIFGASSSVFKDSAPPDSGGENLFQAALQEQAEKKLPDSSCSPSKSNSASSSGEGENILGQNLTEKVTGVHTSPKGLVSSSGFVFGENLAERVQFNQDGHEDKPEDNGVASPDSTEQSDSANNIEREKTLEESAREYQATHKRETELEEVEVVTGEENESNVLQTNGKLFVFDGDTQNWIERGRGLLRLNDMRCESSQTFQSRLLMRTQGSLRLILNTKIWPGMTVERASQKSVRVTGTDGDHVKVFLIISNPKDSENLLRALDWRVQQLRVQEEKLKESGEVSGKRKAEPESPTEEFAVKKTKKSDDEAQASYKREESDSSVVDPETEVSSESHASSFTLRTDSD